MGIFSKVAAVSTLGASTLVQKGYQAQSARHDASVAAKAEAKAQETTRVVTLKGSPKDLGKKLDKEIRDQASQGYAMTSQSTYAGRARLASAGVMTVVFTKVQSG